MAYNTRSSAHTTRSKTKTPHKATTTATTLKTNRTKTPKSAPTTKKTPSHRTGAGVAKKPRHKRKPHISDKLEGALLKVEGTLTGRRGVKVCSLSRPPRGGLLFGLTLT